MFNKRNIAIVFAMVQMVFSVSAMDTSIMGNIDKLYAELRLVQGEKVPFEGISTNLGDRPESGGYSAMVRVNMRRSNLGPIFGAAEKTGLQEQYKTMLTKPTSQTKEFLDAFINPEYLRFVAFSQNRFGHADVFNFDQKKGIPRMVALMGLYNGSQGKIPVFNYSFFHALREQLVELAKELQHDLYLVDLCNTIVKNLNQALENAKAQPL